MRDFFIDDWRRVLLLSWAVWAQIIGLLSIVLPEAVYLLFSVDVNPYVLGYFGMAMYLIGAVGRFVKQPRRAVASWGIFLPLVVFALAISAGLASASAVDKYRAQEAKTFAIWLPHAEVSEGVRLMAYLDHVGNPTICMGSTRVNGQPVRMGMRMTMAECRALLEKDARSHRNGLLAFYAQDTVLHRLPPPRDAAFADMAFNVGIAAAGKSTAMRRLNAGDVAGACHALTWWNKAGGRVARGLVVRVTWRADQCRIGVA